MSDGRVRRETLDGVAVVTIDRPRRRNALTGRLIGELRTRLAAAEADPDVLGIVLTGAGGVFCSGQDLTERRVPPGGHPPDLAATLAAGFDPLVRGIRDATKPVVAAVEGAAAGAGANLALAAHVVVAAAGAVFVEGFVRVGLMPDTGGTWFLPRALGRARAFGVALTGEPVDAETAARWGLVARVVPRERLLAAACDVARALA